MFLTPTTRKRIQIGSCAVLAVSFLCLWILPSARQGLKVLCNRVFAASEADNSYVYLYFPTEEKATDTLALILLLVIAFLLCLLIAVSKRLYPALLAAIAAAGIQVYFGLSLPAWANVLLFGALALKTILSGLDKKKALFFAAGICLVSALVFVIAPGVHEKLEQASEQVRDALGELSGEASGFSPSEADRLMMTRHVNLRSLVEGTSESASAQTYQIEIQDEEQISQPEWIRYVRTGILLLLVVLLLSLPFLPFLLFGKRRRYLMEKRDQFDSEHLEESVKALFFYTTTWLQTAGYGDSQTLFVRWPDSWSGQLPESYRIRFLQGVVTFEEAVYSEHALQEASRTQMSELLKETEELVISRADWKQKLRLRMKIPG